MDKKILTIWTEMNSRLRFFVSKYISDKDDIDDLLQEVFLKLMENIHRIKEISRIESWIFQVTRNLINDHYRKKNKAISEDFCDDCTSESSKNDNPFTVNTYNYINQLIDNLPEEFKDIIIEVDYKNRKLIDYAESNNLSYSAAKSRIQRARKKIKDQLYECCHYEIDSKGNVTDYWEKKK